LAFAFFDLFRKADFSLMTHLVCQMQLLDCILKILDRSILLVSNLVMLNIETSKLNV
jgi:hypothetical protein